MFFGIGKGKSRIHEWQRIGFCKWKIWSVFQRPSGNVFTFIPWVSFRECLPWAFRECPPQWHVIWDPGHIWFVITSPVPCLVSSLCVGFGKQRIWSIFLFCHNIDNKNTFSLVGCLVVLFHYGARIKKDPEPVAWLSGLWIVLKVLPLFQGSGNRGW